MYYWLITFTNGKTEVIAGDHVGVGEDYAATCYPHLTVDTILECDANGNLTEY